MFWFFGHKAFGILAPQPGIEPAPPAPEGNVLTTGPPGKTLKLSSYMAKNFPEMVPVTPHSTGALSNNVSPLSPTSSPDHKKTEEQK